jgi:hypothetical protein
MIFSWAGLGAAARPLATAGASFAASKSCPGTMPILASLAHRRVSGRRGIGLQKLGEQLEVDRGVHGLDLIPNRGLHVDRGIERSGCRRVRLAVPRQRHRRHLILERVHLLVILGRAGAVDAAQNPDDPGRGLGVLSVRLPDSG